MTDRETQQRIDDLDLQLTRLHRRVDQMQKMVADMVTLLKEMKASVTGEADDNG